jgi:hypothetical protein
MIREAVVAVLGAAAILLVGWAMLVWTIVTFG